MVITPYNKHRRLLSSPASFLVLNRKRRLRIEREPSLLSNQFTTIALLPESVISTPDGGVRCDKQKQSVCSGLLWFRCRDRSHVRVDVDGRKEIGCGIC